MVCSTYCEAPAKVSGGSRTNFSGKANAGAPDTRDDEAPPEKCKIYIYIYISSRIFENIPQNGPEYSHRKLAIASFLVTAVRKNIGGLLSWLVSLTSSVPELTRHGLERGLHVNP